MGGPGAESDLLAAAMTAHEVLAILGGIKPLFKAVTAAVTLIAGKFGFKYDSDLPAPILVVLAIAEVYALSLVQDAGDRDAVLKWLVIGLVASSIVFLLVYRYLSYLKTVDKMPAWWQFWRTRYPQIRIVGGYWLLPAATRAITENDLTTAEYFAGVAFDEDRVWSRPSRALAWLTLVVTYFILILTAVGTLFLVSEALLHLQTGGGPYISVHTGVVSDSRSARYSRTHRGLAPSRVRYVRFAPVRSILSEEKKLSIAALSQTLPEQRMLEMMP